MPWSHTRLTMLLISGVECSSTESITVYTFLARRPDTSMCRNSDRIQLLLCIASELMESMTTSFSSASDSRIRYSTFSITFSSMVGLSTRVACSSICPDEAPIIRCDMQSTKYTLEVSISKASMTLLIASNDIVDVT